MKDMIASLLSFLLLYRYFALFIIIFVSNIIFFLPSNAIVLVTGFFTNVDYFNFYWSFLIIAVANTLADFLVYFLAKKFPQHIDKQLKRQKIFSLDRLKNFLTIAAAPTIILSRISGVFAISINFLSGLAEIKPIRFLIYDLIGNSLVAGILLYLGFLVGSNWEQMSDVIDYVTVILSLIFVVFFVYKAYKNHKKAQ